MGSNSAPSTLQSCRIPLLFLERIVPLTAVAEEVRKKSKCRFEEPLMERTSNGESESESALNVCMIALRMETIEERGRMMLVMNGRDRDATARRFLR